MPSPKSPYNSMKMAKRSPRDIAGDSSLSTARRIELLKMIKAYNAAPAQRALSHEADVELSRLLSGAPGNARPRA